MEQRVSSTRFSITMLGALLIFLGSAVLTNADDVTTFVVRLIGFACSVFALVLFGDHFSRAKAIDAIPFEELVGAGILLLIGALIALFPAQSEQVLFVILGVMVILSGLGDIARSRKMVANDDQEERMTLRIGIVTVATGLFVTILPAIAAHVLPVICGIALVLDGLSELYIALTMGNDA